MNLFPRVAALLIAAGPAYAEGPAPIAVTVASHKEVLLDPPGNGTAAHPGLRAAESALQSHVRAALSNLVCGAGALAGIGPGPWRVHADVLEWISPEQLRDAFGDGVPGIAVQVSLFDASLGDRIPFAVADFPAAADRLNASKSLRVLSVERAADHIATWTTTEIVTALKSPIPQTRGTLP